MNIYLNFHYFHKHFLLVYVRTTILGLSKIIFYETTVLKLNGGIGIDSPTGLIFCVGSASAIQSPYSLLQHARCKTLGRKLLVQDKFLMRNK